MLRSNQKPSGYKLYTKEKTMPRERIATVLVEDEVWDLFDVRLTGFECCGYRVAVLIPESSRPADTSFAMAIIKDRIESHMKSVFPLWKNDGNPETT